jgi:hypothetical protein
VPHLCPNDVAAFTRKTAIGVQARGQPPIGIPHIVYGIHRTDPIICRLQVHRPVTFNARNTEGVCCYVVLCVTAVVPPEHLLLS